MNQPPLNNPNARCWDGLVQDFEFSPRRSSTLFSRAQTA
jgi:hypothetical protein